MQFLEVAFCNFAPLTTSIMQTLQSIFKGIVLKGLNSEKAQTIVANLCIDSRRVQPQALFVAIKGTAQDGHAYIDAAVRAGAVAILCEEMPPEVIQQKVICLQVSDTSEVLGLAAANFFGNPSQKMNVVGVTGTNGKTTSVTLLADLYEALGYRVGMIGTVENRIAGQRHTATHTTPDAIQLQALLAKMLEADCTHVFMEVSSHAIAQRRIAGLCFRAAAFTNLTHDHLDYHGTFANYLAAKKRLFDDLPKEAFALTNNDDKNGSVMLQNCSASRLSYSLKRLANFKGKIISNSFEGLELEINEQRASFMLTGEFNAYNLLLVYGVAVQMGEEPNTILQKLSALGGAKGRFERLISPQRVFGIVDYAHTPDALENVLQTILKGKNAQQRVITVVGCGGNRDATKRPKMAKIAAQMSQKVLLTSDNPRFEEPEAILADMKAGLDDNDLDKTELILDRRLAIQRAVVLAKGQDIILIAGKGHENYQEVAGVKHHFDDLEELKKAFGL